jgi:hypothetical protein
MYYSSGNCIPMYYAYYKISSIEWTAYIISLGHIIHVFSIEGVLSLSTGKGLSFLVTFYNIDLNLIYFFIHIIYKK